MTLAQLFEQEEKKGIEKGIEKGKIELVKRMLKANIDMSQILEVSELSLEKIRELQKELERESK